MGWTYKHRKKRDEIRRAWTEKTGSTDYSDPAFWEWAKQFWVD